EDLEESFEVSPVENPRAVRVVLLCMVERDLHGAMVHAGRGMKQGRRAHARDAIWRATGGQSLDRLNRRGLRRVNAPARPIRPTRSVLGPTRSVLGPTPPGPS